MEWAELAVLVAIFAHIIASPFTKVEESFNMQATHDFLYHGMNITAYDHHMYPGVVPRTFAGAAAVATASFPIIATANAFALSEEQLFLGVLRPPPSAPPPQSPKLLAQYLVRAVLGLASWLSIRRLAFAVRERLGPRTATYFALLTAVQFHVPFYASRFLPNTFALILCNVASAEWILGKRPGLVVYLMAFTVTVVRCDTALLAAPMGLMLLFSRKISLKAAIMHGAAAVGLSLALTVPLDSFLWRRFLWPEGEVFWFNTALGKSVEWGTSPAHWYFTSALPRALLAGLPLSLLGPFYERRVRPQLLAAWVFVGLYSFLAHKARASGGAAAEAERPIAHPWDPSGTPEVRFLFPVLLLFNVGAACFLSKAHLNRRKSTAWRFVFTGGLLALAACLAATCVMSYAAYWNYPGGWALQRLHRMQDGRVREAKCPAGGAKGVTVHIGVLPAMTGVSRFGEKRGDGWEYHKTEGLGKKDFKAKRYDYLLAGEQGIPGYVLAGVEEGFVRLARVKRFPFLGVATQPQVFILARSDLLKSSPCADTT